MMLLSNDMGMQKSNSNNTQNAPFSVSITLWLILLMAVMWLGFSLLVTLGLHPSYSRLGIFRWIMAGLTFLAGGILISIWILLQKHNRFAWYAAVIMLAAMAMAGLFDDIGLIDIVYMIGALVPLVLLIKDRNWYMN